MNRLLFKSIRIVFFMNRGMSIHMVQCEVAVVGCRLVNSSSCRVAFFPVSYKSGETFLLFFTKLSMGTHRQHHLSLPPL